MHRQTSRRQFLTGGLASLAPGLVIAKGALTLGLTPVFLTSDRELLNLIKHYLEGALGSPVRLVMRRTYQEITTLLLAGQLDAAWICGYPYVRHKADLSLVAVPVWRGRQLYQAYQIVQAERPADDLRDLKGDIHAFSDPDSNSGFLVTRSQLAAVGATPDSFFSRHFFTYGHRNVVRAVASGLARSGSVDGYVWEALAVAEPGLAAQTRVIWKSEWLGFPPIACGRDSVGTYRVDALKVALTAMNETDVGRRALELLQLDAFATAQPGLFAGIEARLKSVQRGR